MWEDLILFIEGQVSWILCRNFWYTNRKWVFPDIGVPQNGWFTMEDPIFYWTIWGDKPTIFGNIQMHVLNLFFLFES